jgi:hypothetical protein
MDINALISETKARFSHNSAKEYLREKYDSKLILATQGGLWKASPEVISFLNSLSTKNCILLDNFKNPIEIDRVSLLNELSNLYQTVMQEWYAEWQELEGKR